MIEHKQAIIDPEQTSEKQARVPRVLHPATLTGTDVAGAPNAGAGPADATGEPSAAPIKQGPLIARARPGQDAEQFRSSGRCRREMLAASFSPRDPKATLDQGNRRALAGDRAHLRSLRSCRTPTLLRRRRIRIDLSTAALSYGSLPQPEIMDSNLASALRM
jgi:hypothetical protein